VIGPAIAAVGFVLFSLPSVGGIYWTTFFPGMLTLGFGMAVTVAPLTTVVMKAVDQDRVGTASGINNAVSRAGGLLAIAVLGAAMVVQFSGKLDRQLEKIAIPPGVRAELRSNATKLADLKAPAGVTTQGADAIASSVVQSFVSTFREMVWICAALALASAAVAWRTIQGEAQRTPNRAAAQRKSAKTRLASDSA
jgi:hypothetical protein